MKYKGYLVETKYIEDENILFGKVVGIETKLEFRCKSVDEIQECAKQMIDDYLDVCKINNTLPDISTRSGVSYKLVAKFFRELYEAEDFACGSICTAKMEELLCISFYVGCKNSLCIYDDALTGCVGKKIYNFNRLFFRNGDEFSRVNNFEERNNLSCDNIPDGYWNNEEYDTDEIIKCTDNLRNVFDSCSYLPYYIKKLCFDVFLNFASFTNNRMFRVFRILEKLNGYVKSYFSISEIDHIANVNDMRDFFLAMKPVMLDEFDLDSDFDLLKFILNYNIGE